MDDKELNYYKNLCDELKKENVELKAQKLLTETKCKEAEDNLNRIKNSFFWKMIKPLRALRVLFIRVKRCGSPKQIAKKIIYKKRLKKAYVALGTGSFPSEEQRKAESSKTYDREIVFSILVPIYNTPENFLREMIESVVNQTYPFWELVLADGSDSEHENVGRICKEYADKDERIRYSKLDKNLGIAGNTNACYRMATGEYVGLFDHDDILHPSAFCRYRQEIDEKNADFIYCDEVTFKNGCINNMITIHFKPDYAIDTLRANNYICHFSLFKRELLQETDFFRTEFDGSQDHDMILRLTSIAKNVCHVPGVYYYWRSHAGSVASGIEAKPYCIDAARRAIDDHLRKHGIYNTVITSTRAFATIFRLQYEIKERDLISVIIPSKDNRESLRKLIDSIEKNCTYDNYEIIICENNSTEKETFDYYDSLKENPRVSVIKYEGEFNYSAVNNFGVKEAKGKYLLFLNNDIEVITPSFFEEMLMYVQREDVGACGCKLLYPNNTIQHAGIVLGLGADRVAGHILYGESNENIGYMGRLCYAQNVSAVTGAALMVSKADFEAVGGFDEKLRIALNDVDLCLKLRKEGKLNVFTPFAEAYHYESLTRGSDASDSGRERYEKEIAIFKEKWAEELEQGDPYYNPFFTLDKSDYTLKMVAR